MRKGFLMVLAVALVAALAAPAMAGTDINGFYRAKGYVTNFDLPSAPGVLADNTLSNNLDGGGYVEQRFRMRFSFGEENVKAVAFFEIDFSSWGDSAGGVTASGNSSADRNNGGALGGDKINLETKNVYVWFKVPDTSLEFTVGLQNQTDNFYGLLYGAADMAGIFATGKYEPVNWKLGWAKLYENETTQWDDLTLYMGYLSFAPSKESKLGFGVYFLDDATQKMASTAASAAGGLDLPWQSTSTATAGFPFGPSTPAGSENTKQIWTVGLDGAYNASWGSLTGFFLYQFGTVDFINEAEFSDADISAFAADLRVDANVGPGKLFVEGLILSGGDNSGDKYQAPVTLSDVATSPNGNSAFTRLDYQILMGNADDINQNTCLLGCAAAVGNNQSPGNQGRGMWTVGGGYSMKVAEKTTMKLGAGYLAAMKTLQGELRDKDMGLEFNGNVNYNIMKGLDFGLYAAWAFIGDFYKGTTTSGLSANDNPDDAYTMFFRLNYAF